MERTVARPLPLAKIALGAAVLAYVSVLAFLAWYLPTWTDEEYTLSTTAHGLAFAWSHAIALEEQAPLYFGIISIWRAVDQSVLFTRLFSLMCVLGTLALVPALVRRVCPAFDARIITFLIAINPFVIFAAVEARLYAAALLIGTALYLTFLDGFLQRDSRKAQIAFGVLAVVGLWLQYYLGFLLPSFGIALVVAKRYRELVPYAVCCLVAALSIVPLGVAIHSQLGALADAAVPFSKTVGVSLSALRSFLGLGKVDSRISVGLILLVLVTARPLLSRENLALFAAAAVTLLEFLVVTPLTNVQVVPRHQVGVFAALAFAIFTLVARRGKTYLAVVAVAYVALSSYALYATYHTGAKDGDWRRVGKLLSTQAEPGDTIALFTADSVLPLRRYYDGTARIVPLPKPMDMDRWSPRDIKITSQAEADALLDPHLLGGRHVFLVEDVCEYPEYGCKYFDATIAREYTVLNHWSFNLSEVSELQAR